MWNKFIILLLLLAGSQSLFSQTWLNKTDTDLLQYISENKERISNQQQSDTLLVMTCQEEDELGRLFDVTYHFHLKNHLCTSYCRFANRPYILPALLEQVSLQEADSAGEEIEIDGEMLHTIYIFDDYRIHVSSKDDCLYLHYIQTDE